MRKSSVLLLALAIAMTLPIVQFLAVKGMWRATSIYWAHLLDLILNAPLLLAILLGMFQLIRRESDTEQPILQKTKTALTWMAGFSTLLFFEGHGIHYAANSISPLIDRRNDSQRLVALTHLYDEFVGHWMLLMGLAGLFFVLMLFEHKRHNDRPCNNLDRVIIVVASLISGTASALILLEGQFAALGFLMCGVTMAVAALTKMHEDGLQRRPVGCFVVLSSLVSVLVLTAWVLSYGSFVEPGVRPHTFY